MPGPFSDNKLEPQYREAFTAWQQKPSPQTTGQLLKAVDPDIEKGISAHVGHSNPLLKSRARQLTLGALASYDPKQARLGTHLVNQLQSLKRISRQQTQIISMPERVALDQTALYHTENALREDLGREPSTQELADKAGMSLKRIAKLRAYQQPVNSGFFEDRGGEEMSYLPAVQHSNRAWVEAVYGDLSPIDQLIMEHTLGLHGRPVLSNQKVAARLQLSPGAISQRKAKIQQLLNQEDALSPF